MDKFSLTYYKKSITIGLDNGYQIKSCKFYNSNIKNNKIILLRHDVDFNFNNSIEMAKIESELGVTATYFLRLHAKNYNLLEYSNIKKIEKIIKMGHEVGLHFEPDFYHKEGNDISINLQNEVSFLSKLLSYEIVGASIHEPSRRGNNITQKVIDKTSLEYESYLLPTTYKYISDSGGRWREGDLIDWVNKKEKKIYVNTHPVWWYNNTPLENY